MERTALKDPKEDQITNKDDSITNKDGDNYLEKGEQPIDQKETDSQIAPTVTADNDEKNTKSPTEIPLKNESKAKRSVI